MAENSDGNKIANVGAPNSGNDSDDKIRGNVE